MLDTDGVRSEGAQSQITRTTGTTSNPVKYKTTPAQDKKAWLIYAAEVFTRLALSGGLSAALTQGYDATKNTPISEKEIVAAIVSNVVFFALDNSRKGLLDNKLKQTSELPQTPMQVFKSLVQAIAVFVLSVVATYAVGKADLSEMMGLGLIVLAANLLKAVVEKAVNHFLLDRPVVLLTASALQHPLKLSDDPSEHGQHAGSAFGDGDGDGRRVFSGEQEKTTSPYSRLTDVNDGNGKQSSITNCWAAMKNCCGGKGENPHGSVATTANPMRN
jgi:hypothetical protein